MALDYSQYPTGWIADPAAVAEVMAALPMPTFGAAAADLPDPGEGAEVHPWKLLEKVRGSYPLYIQTEGTCTSKGRAKSVALTLACQIAAGAKERWPGDIATEDIYAGSRVEIGGGRLRGDGSIGAWTAKYVVEYGTLPRGKYGRYDLTKEDDRIAVAWGRPGAGVPDELEPIARQHSIKTVSQVRTVAEARTALANGYGFDLCSNRGFATRRDRDGFLAPQGTWPHCMACVGYVGGRRPGFIIDNSWPKEWISGPLPDGWPSWFFLADAEVVENMLRAEDSWAVSGFVGFPEQPLDYSQF